MDKQHTEQVEKLSDNMDKLTNSLADGLNLLKQLLQPQIFSHQPMFHQPMMYSGHPPMYPPTFDDNSPRPSAQQPTMYRGPHPTAHQPTFDGDVARSSTYAESSLADTH